MQSIERVCQSSAEHRESVSEQCRAESGSDQSKECVIAVQSRAEQSRERAEQRVCQSSAEQRVYACVSEC